MGRMLFTACANKDLAFRTMLIEARNQWHALHQKGKGRMADATTITHRSMSAEMMFDG